MKNQGITSRLYVFINMKLNNSSRFASLILAGIGLLDAMYLSWVEMTNNKIYCGGSTSCDTVNNSVYSRISGIPIAYLGVLSYLALLAILFLENKKILKSITSTYLLFGICLIGSLYSIYLTYLEIVVIKAICPYCVVSALVMLILFTLMIIRLKPVLAGE